MKTIYEITVPVTSQEQADRLKAICVKYGLPIWQMFKFWHFGCIFTSDSDLDFYIMSNEDNIKKHSKDKTPITESEFLLLAKEFKTK
jgi:hypothetical protein